MNPTSLKEQLVELQRTLAAHPELDADSLAMLQDIVGELKERGVEIEPELSDRLAEQAVQFEHEYPRLAAVLNQIVITLGRIGI